MRIAVIGTGGVGGAFGAALAKAGADVTFVARGAHLAAMKANGLKVVSPRGDVHIKPCQATDNPADIGVVDFVLFCVKLWDVETAGMAIKSLIGPNTAVIPLQNGIDAAERLVPILGKHAVMGGVAQISAMIQEPGVIAQTGTFMKIVFGELDGSMSERGAAFLEMCKQAGFDVQFTEAIQVALWEKFVLLAVNSSVVALVRQPFGKLHPDADIMNLFSTAFAEVIACARALGIKLHPEMQARVEKATRNFPPSMMPSMALDLQRGNRLELPWLGGKVVELGKQLGVPTPTFNVMYAALKLYANGEPK